MQKSQEVTKQIFGQREGDIPPWAELAPEPPLFREKQVCRDYGLSTTGIYEGMAAGTFPKPVRIGRRAVAWPKSWLDAWLRDRAEKSFPRVARKREAI